MRASHKVLMASKLTSAKECGHVQQVGFEVNGKEAHMWMTESWKQPQVPLTTINHKPHAIGDCMHLTRSSMHTHHGAHPHTCMTVESGDHCVDHHTIHSSQPHTSPSTLCLQKLSFNYPLSPPSLCSTKQKSTWPSPPRVPWTVLFWMPLVCNHSCPHQQPSHCYHYLTLCLTLLPALSLVRKSWADACLLDCWLIWKCHLSVFKKTHQEVQQNPHLASSVNLWLWPTPLWRHIVTSHHLSSLVSLTPIFLSLQTQIFL